MRFLGWYHIATTLGKNYDVIKWKHLPRNWPFVREIHWLPVNSPQEGQWRGALMFPLLCALTNVWANNRDAGDLRRQRANYDVTILHKICRVTLIELPPFIVLYLPFMKHVSLERYLNITVTLSCARWRFKSPASRLFTQPFNQAKIKENIKASRHCPLCGEFTGHQWIPRTNGQ